MGEEDDDVDGVDATSLLVISNGRCARAGLEGSMMISQPLWPWDDDDNDEEGQRRGNYTPKSGASSAQSPPPVRSCNGTSMDPNNDLDDRVSH